jgi:menaquinone-specific isochorismate synthase
MPTIPDHRIQFETLQELCACFRAAQQDCHPGLEAPILSLAVDLPGVDPLAVLQQFSRPRQQFYRHFYFEKNGQACLGLDVVAALEVAGVSRYQQVRQFIRQTARRMLTIRSTSLPFSQPRFFCGFAFSPEVPKEDAFTAGSVLLPRWQIYRQGSHSVVIANVLVDDRFTPETAAQEVWNFLNQIRAGYLSFCSAPTSPQLLQYQPVSTAEQFEQSVQSALDAIAQKHCHKIVLAHALDITFAQSIPWLQTLQNLRDTHPNCYVFSNSSNKGAIFLGASPEKLAAVQGNVLTTDALAGSAPRGQNEVEELLLAKTLLTNRKERLEHQVVVDFIRRRLNQLELEPELLPTKLLQLANIQHLHTPLQATLPEHLHLLDIVAALHPTPAMAGFPQQVACEYIHHHETFSRSRYAGPVGWVDLEGNGEFAVGIRSAIIQDATARLFAGAGVVAGSQPAQEFAEVQLKLKALLSTFIRNGV